MKLLVWLTNGILLLAAIPIPYGKVGMNIVETNSQKSSHSLLKHLRAQSI